MTYHCADCDWSGGVGELDGIPERGIFERVMPGERMPEGQCPKCGAFAYRATGATRWSTEDGKPVLRISIVEDPAARYALSPTEADALIRRIADVLNYDEDEPAAVKELTV